MTFPQNKFWADVRVQKVAWSRNRWSAFANLVSKDAKTGKKKKNHKKACLDQWRSWRSRRFCAGRGQIDPRPQLR